MKKILYTFKEKWAEFILEIVVIIISIILALMIDSWKTKVEENNLKEDFLERLASDLYVDKENIELIIEIQEAKKENVEHIIKVVQENSAIDTLLRTILEGSPTFYPVVGNYQSALATGKLEIIKDNDLLNLIIGLYDSYLRLQYNSKNSDEQWFNIRNKYKRVLRTQYLDLNQVEPEDFLDDLYLYNEGLDFYIGRCRETLSEIQNLISNLE